MSAGRGKRGTRNSLRGQAAASLRGFSVLLWFPWFVPFQQAVRPPDSALLAQFADVDHQLFDLIVAKSRIRRHLALPFSDDRGQLRIRLTLHFRRTQVANIQLLSHGRLAAPVCPMTHRALSFESRL